MRGATTTAAIWLGLTVASSAAASLIESGISAGTIARGPKAMRDSILVQEDMWFGVDYLKQIAFVQSFECAASGGSGKHLTT